MPFVTQNGPELALLLAVARVELAESEKSHITQLLAGGLDWERLPALAEMHGLGPLLFHHLQQNAEGMAPPEAMQRLREISIWIAGRNLLLAAKLRVVSAHLRSRGIEHISFKGPLLAEVYYGNLTLRASSDLDILVPGAKVVSARDALGEIGFTDLLGLNQAQQALVFRLNHEHGFTAADGVMLDLQWGLAQRIVSRTVDMAGIWRRVTMARLLDFEVPTFCPEDQLFALALHAGNDNHAWSQFSLFCDMAQVLRKHPQLNWDVVESNLGDAYVRRSIYASLFVLHKYWQAQIPKDVLDRISSDPHVARLAHRAQTEWWPEPNMVETKPALSWLLDRSRGQAVRDRARLLFGRVLTPTRNDFKVITLPRVLERSILRCGCYATWANTLRADGRTEAGASGGRRGQQHLCYSQNLHFAFPAPDQCTPSCIPSPCVALRGSKWDN